VILRRVTNLEIIQKKNKNGDLFTDSYSIMARWRSYFSQLLNICRVNDIRETEMLTAEPLVPELSALNFR
jgi:hypothetical protein